MKLSRPPANHLPVQVARKVSRKLRARAAPPTLWFGLGLVGMIGWSVALPTVLGALLGVWLDRVYPGRFSWTLSLLLAGLALGCIAAWQWVDRMRPPHD
ncbi:MAG: AtpZ/AtpI family protein [Candidatus Competibacter sp.]|nr:AtpZ/AtpI family protein [Candidatus Competibacter sp.]MCC9004090.1 AtpZ/AtpI family protein [Candidatus Competibacter sp.]